MPYLKPIAAYINAALEDLVFDDDVYANRQVNGIAQSLPRSKGERLEVLPSVVDHAGEARYLGPDDDFDLMTYHRVNGIAVTKGTGKGFGDDRAADVDVARLSLVVFGRREQLQQSNDELAVLIRAAFPETADRPLRELLKFYACNININDIILNDLQVFAEEYRGIEYFLKPDQFLFKINYTIESAFLKKCFIKSVS
jgi:hypothetical protein